MKNTDTEQEIKVLVVDDHPLVREGISKILSLDPSIKVIGEAEDGGEAIKKARTLNVDVVLMDINMPNINGIKATKVIKSENPDISVIALTIHEQEEYLFELIQCGVSGYVLKDVRPNELIKTIHDVAAGYAFIPPSLTQKVFNEFIRLTKNKQEEPRNLFDLTDRETEILEQMSKGLSNKEIADKLFISEKTVKNHITNIFQKIDVSDRTQAVLFAIKHDIVNID